MPQTPSKVGDDKPPPPSPATEGNTAFAGNNGEGDLSDNQASANEVGGIEGSGDPTYSSRATGGEKYGRANDHPHLAYIYRGRGTTQPADEGGDGQEEGEVRFDLMCAFIYTLSEGVGGYLFCLSWCVFVVFSGLTRKRSGDLF